MKKIGRLTFGGLQQRLFNLVGLILLMLIGFFSIVSAYQSRQLTKVVRETNKKQQAAIKEVTGNTMHQVIESSMTKTNGLQAYIADDMFSDIATDISTLRSIAQSLFEHSSDIAPAGAYLPDPDNKGVLSAQVLYEEGVDYTESALLGIAAHMSNTMISMCENSGYMQNCFIGMADGTHIAIDDDPLSKYDENGEMKPFPVRQRPWYIGACQAGDIWFSGPEIDTYTGKICVECSAPVVVNSEIVAVVGSDLFLDAMADYVSADSEYGEKVCVINKSGHVIFAPENNGVFTVRTTDMAQDLRESDNKELADFVSKALGETTGLVCISVNGKDYYMTGSPIATVGWAVISFLEKEITEMPEEKMVSEFSRITADATSDYSHSAEISRQVMLLIMALILGFGSIAAFIVAGKTVRPIECMTKRISEISGTDMAFEMEDTYKTGDEIEVLAKSFETLSTRTREYINQITEITAEKERVGTELALATKIQADMLPNIFPPFPERKDFDIYATMTPAKEVGGDFYDFFLIDDDHLGLVMADVSGKGVPAALFMMMSKILVSNYAMVGESPAKVLEQVNNQICKNNEEEMFVTVWFGVLELSTGKVKAANAGHEYPIIKKSEGGFELFKDRHGFVIGGMESARYKEYEFTLDKGGVLFLYTDGVAEATNSQNELFGTDRTVDALNSEPDASPEELLKKITADMKDFVGNAPQFDDITMLAVKLL